MAAEGSEQNRLKTEIDAKLEIRSIERELDKIGQARLAAQAEYAAGNEAIEKQLETHFSEIEKTLELQKILTEEMLKQSKAAESAPDFLLKADAEALLKVARGQHDIAVKTLKEQRRSLGDLNSNLRLEQQLLAEKVKQNEAVQNMFGKLGGVFERQKQWYKLLKDTKIVSGKMLGMWASLAAILTEVWSVFLKVDEGLAKFRMHMGFIRPDMERLKQDMLDVATELARVGVNIEGVTTAVIALGDEFGSVRVISRDLIETTSLLKAQLGVAEVNSAGFLRNISALSQTTAQTQRSMAFVAKELTTAAGVPLNLVMQDVAKMSGNALALVSKMPMQIVKTAVAARAMGTTINKIADASANLLNFTESVQAEMEASVLVGTAVNLQLSRQLAYQGKIVESTKAIVAEARRVNFEKLDYFQMQSFAAASGRSVDELLKMIQAQRQLAAARQNSGLKAEVELMDKLAARRDAQLKDNALQTEMSVKQMANQERIAALQQQWNELIMEATRVLYPVFDALLQISIVAVKLLPVFGAFAGIVTVFSNLHTVLKAVGGAMFVFVKGAGIFGSIGKSLVGVSSSLVPIAGFFSKMIGFFGKFAGWAGGLIGFAAPFAKAIPVIGWILAAFQFIYRLFVRYQEFVGKDGMLIGGLKAIGYALYDVLLKPFADVFNWLGKWWLGHSPSGIGLSIVKGIASVGTMLFDALTWPWRKFLAWVVEKVPFMGGIAKKISGGVTGFVEDVGVLDKKVTITPEARASEKPETATAAAKATTEQNKQEQDSVTLGEILKSIRDLNSNLMAGKIGIYIDGQLMSATLARQTAFRGGYGTNQANMG